MRGLQEVSPQGGEGEFTGHPGIKLKPFVFSPNILRFVSRELLKDLLPCSTIFPRSESFPCFPAIEILQVVH